MIEIRTTKSKVEVLPAKNVSGPFSPNKPDVGIEIIMHQVVVVWLHAPLSGVTIELLVLVNGSSEIVVVTSFPWPARFVSFQLCAREENMRNAKGHAIVTGVMVRIRDIADVAELFVAMETPPTINLVSTRATSSYAVILLVNEPSSSCGRLEEGVPHCCTIR